LWTPEENPFFQRAGRCATRPGQRLRPASAIRGEFGDHRAARRAEGSKLFINALTSLYWCYDLSAVASSIGLHSAIVGTKTFREVDNAIRLHHAGIAQCNWLSLPL
jgi:hypothetical protein